MRTFILKCVLFTAIATGVFLLVASRYQPRLDAESDFMASIIDKHKRLNEVQGERMLLVGGSNWAFGINSERLQEKFNYQVVNMSIHAGLGLEFILNEAASQVKKGDVVLLCLEYDLYNPANKSDIDLIEHTQLFFPESKSYYQFNFAELSSQRYTYFRKTVDKQVITPGTIYNRKNFNEFGDLVIPLDEKKKSKLIGSGKQWKTIRNIASVETFRKLADKCKEVGAELHLLFPCYPKTEFDKHKPGIRELKKKIKEELGFIHLVNEPGSFVYADKYFFDTIYHLTREGKELRTNTLIRLLEGILPPLENVPEPVSN